MKNRRLSLMLSSMRVPCPRLCFTVSCGRYIRSSRSIDSEFFSRSFKNNLVQQPRATILVQQASSHEGGWPSAHYLLPEYDRCCLCAAIRSEDSTFIKIQ
jgi:hypothetical protein